MLNVSVQCVRCCESSNASLSFLWKGLMGSGVLMGEHAAFALPSVLLFVCGSGIAATARLLVRVEDEMQLMEKLFDIHGRALLQTK